MEEQLFELDLHISAANVEQDHDLVSKLTVEFNELYSQATSDQIEKYEKLKATY